MPLFKFLGILDSDPFLSFRKKVELPVPSIIGEDQPLNPYTEIQILQEHTDIVRLLLRIDGSRCVSAGDDNTAVIWDYEYGRVLHILRGHIRPITCMLLHEPSYGLYGQKTLLLTGSSDQMLMVWDVKNGRCLRILKNHESTLRCLAHVEDKRFVCGAGQNIIVWGPNLSFLCAHELINQEDITQLICLNSNQLVGCMNKQLAVFTFSTVAGTIRGVKFVCKLKCHREAVRALVGVNDYSFASGSLDGEIIIWSTETWMPALHLNAHKPFIRNTDLYPDSIQYLLLLNNSNCVVAAIGNGFCVYDCNTGSMLFAHLHAHRAKILHIQLIFSGLLLGTCSEDGSVRFWGFPHLAEKKTTEEAKTVREEAATVLLPIQQMCDKLKNRSDNSLIEEPELVGECVGHTGAVTKILNLGRTGFASCGMDKLVILWKDGNYQCKWRTKHLCALPNSPF